MTGDISSTPNPGGSPGEASGSRSGLRTCLLVGVGCLAILAIGACIAAAVFLPRLRTVVDDVQSQIGVDNLQDFTDLINPDNLIDGVEAVPTPAPDVCVDDLCLSYPDGFNLEAMVTTVPAALEPEFWAIPEHSEIGFTTYPLQDTFHAPHLSIFGVESFRQVNSNVGSMLDELSSILLTRPDRPESIPLIPIFNAAQMILTQVEYLQFDGGTGVRFITQYGQAIWPINNHDLFYAFMGLSDDGQILISVIMPVSNLDLPDDPETVIGPDMDSFAQGYQAYIDSTEAMLDSAGSGTFTPSLDQLDALMGSIQLLPSP